MSSIIGGHAGFRFSSGYRLKKAVYYAINGTAIAFFNAQTTNLNKICPDSASPGVLLKMKWAGNACRQALVGNGTAIALIASAIDIRISHPISG